MYFLIKQGSASFVKLSFCWGMFEDVKGAILDGMKNTALEKFNVAALTAEQGQQLADLEQFIQGHLQGSQPAIAVIEGEAGTGKSVLLTALFKRLQVGSKQPGSPYYGGQNRFVVNHPELLKVYQELTQTEPVLLKKDYLRPTSLINRAHKDGQRYDVIVIDEGHLLLSKPEPYIKFKQQNQLVELIKLAKVVVVVFDFKQVMQSKMLWTPEMLATILAPYPHRYFNLAKQYRLQANQQVRTWLAALGRGEVTPLPQDCGAYDLQVFARASDLYAKIQERDAQVGLARVLSTTGFVRRQANEHHVYMDDFDLPWDHYDGQTTPWAERADSIGEVGSIYTIQGFDLNYAGLILGPPFEYDSIHRRIKINPAKVTHREIYKRRPDLQTPAELAKMKEAVMLNTLNVLVTRGIYGLYLTAADDDLRAALLKGAKDRAIW